MPYSNAAEERIFSMIKKNKIEFRANIDLSKTDSIRVIEMNHPEQMIPCYSMRFSDELLKKCKLACSVYNKEHSSSSYTSNNQLTTQHYRYFYLVLGCVIYIVYAYQEEKSKRCLKHTLPLPLL